MRRNLPGIGIVLLFIIMLIRPNTVFMGACKGLLLWYRTILPSLLPFLILSNLLITSGNIAYISGALNPVFSKIFGTSENGSFALLSGFLCGYPAGAKAVADLTLSGYISAQEGQYLLSLCNNTSPVFILNFLVQQTLENEQLAFPTIFILFVSPFIVSLFTRSGYKLRAGNPDTYTADLTGTEKKWDFHLMDSAILNSCETLIKVGGYIMLFSVLISLWKEIPGVLFDAVLPVLEISNGILLIGNSSLGFSAKYPALLALTSFGGLCAAAQTQCMIQDTELSISRYITEKLAVALTASLLAFLYTRL